MFMIATDEDRPLGRRFKANRVSFREFLFLLPLTFLLPLVQDLPSSSAFLILLCIFFSLFFFYTVAARREKCGRSDLSYHSVFAAHHHVPVNMRDSPCTHRSTNPSTDNSLVRVSRAIRTAAEQCRGNGRHVRTISLIGRWPRAFHLSSFCARRCRREIFISCILAETHRKVTSRVHGFG